MSSRRPVIAGQELLDAFGQVQVAPVGGGKMRMAQGVVQQQEGASAQDFTGTPDESTRKQMITEDRLAVPVYIEGRWETSRRRSTNRPELAGPGGQGIGQRLIATRMRDLREKALRMPEAVGSLTPGEQPQPITCIPLQITDPPQADGSQKEQGQQRLTACGGRRVG